MVPLLSHVEIHSLCTSASLQSDINSLAKYINNPIQIYLDLLLVVAPVAARKL